MDNARRERDTAHETGMAARPMRLRLARELKKLRGWGPARLGVERKGEGKRQEPVLNETNHVKT